MLDLIFYTIWTIALIYNEVIVYHIFSTFPTFSLLVIADPQLTDSYSYKISGILLSITQFYSDIYIKRSFKNIQQRLPLNTPILFLGDLFDGGREHNDHLFDVEYNRFSNLFLYSNNPVYYTVGNHDIGFGDGVHLKKLDRFKSKFNSSVNYSFKLFNKYHIVVLDTVSLSSSIPQVQAESRKFLDSFKVQGGDERVLITHVPLYRSDSSICKGPRIHRPLRQGFGYQYQNLILEQLSREILEKIKPTIVLSGDDHDVCIHDHGNGIVEYTLSTFSWLQGNSQPGYAIVSFDDSINVDIRRLPNQIDIYYFYINLALASLVVCVFSTRVGGRSLIWNLTAAFTKFLKMASRLILLYLVLLFL